MPRGHGDQHLTPLTAINKIKYLRANILEESRNPAIEAYRAAYIANSSNSTPNSSSNPSKKGKNKKKGSYNLAIEEEEEESDFSSNSRYKKRKDFKGKGLKTSSNKAKYKDKKPRRRPRDPALYNSWLYDTGSTDHISNSKERNGPVSLAGIGSIIVEVLPRKAPSTYTQLVLDNVLYLPNININIVSRVRHYDSGGCLIKETLYRGDRYCIAVLDFKKSGFFLDVKGSSKPILHANFAFPLGLSSYTTKSIELQRNKIVVEIPSNSIRKEEYRPIIEDAIVSEAIEPKKRYKLRNFSAKGTTLEGVGPSLRGKRPRRPTSEPKPLTGTRDLPYVLREPVIEGNKVVEKAISSPTLKEPNIEGELVDLDLDLEGAVSPDPSYLNTEKPISIEIGPSKLEPYESSSDSELDEPLPDKPINPVIVESTRPTISIRKPELPETICFIYNGNTVADLGPKLSNTSNITTKLGRDFYSKEGPRPLTTTSTTIVDSRNGKGSSRTSIIDSSLVPIGFSNSDFAGDKATSKSTYSYLYKLAKAIHKVQWIIGLFSKLHRPIDYPITLYRDNQGSITVANNPVLYARTKHTPLKFRYVREQVKAKIVTIIYLNTKCF
ncbi:hypothetical protein P8C59_003130 [Phyllachora maydis]|uniref:Uncharacterized protein n=1 Tax=Phyllachora maydis TaxID=1825666 RepID=A0AAD9HZT0_9PEZI|nr:hypothetical protein P8C59_003130 [Phyllachora maydis]